ncbi:MAG: phosphoglucosamine mutase [Chthonomonas sp.]|nr:phosphoglucosamine mutase [Chthonomonas sp.]
MIKFGTDGVRGVANKALRPEDALAIGYAAGRMAKETGITPRVAMGMDTRRSGSMLGAALAAGFTSAGLDVDDLGVVPTGGISYITRTANFGLGAVISASHNPAEDNGIKLFAHSGKKVADADEKRIVELFSIDDERPTRAEIGTINLDKSEVDRYLEWLLTIVPEGFDGLKVAVDASHGAGFELGTRVLERLGAKVFAVGNTPDGLNINLHCGATHPATIQELTRRVGADIGIAYDGDADRAVFSDNQGRLVNGDRTMAIWAAHWRKHGEFDPPVIVGTVMSNGGFEAYLGSQGIQLVRADVGDKYVSAKIDEHSAPVGGEQSGHIIFPKWGPTGDGLVTALELCRVLKREGRDLASFYDEFENYPQLLVNVKVSNKDGWQENAAIQSAISASESLLASGRLNVRASGTQPILRVMGEHPNVETRDSAVDHVVKTLISELGGDVYSRTDLTYSLGE